MQLVCNALRVCTFVLFIFYMLDLSVCVCVCVWGGGGGGGGKSPKKVIHHSNTGKCLGQVVIFDMHGYTKLPNCCCL